MVPKIWHGYIQRVGKDKTKEKEENKAAKKNYTRLQSVDPNLHSFL
jgi:hypothetical protein